ncbi:cytochrome c biogenesis protein ResB [Chloroflexota bacterium]
MKVLPSKVWKFLQSRNLALVLLAVVLIAVTLAWLFRLHEILSSWSFLTVVALLLLNTMACSITRISNLLNKASRERESLDATHLARLKNRAELQTQKPLADVISTIKATLRRSGYRVVANPDNQASLFAEKGKLGEWGSIVFHLSFLLILLGVIYSGMTRYMGLMVLTEGQTFTEQSQDYLIATRVPFLGEKHQGFQVRLDNFQPTYYKGKTGTDYVAYLVVLENGREVKEKQLRVNQPLTYKGTTFLLEHYGFAPRFILRDASGAELFNRFVNLRVLTEGAEDSFTIPEAGIEVKARFYPDMIMVDGQMRTDSLRPNNPLMSLVVSDGGKTLFEGAVPMEESIEFENTSLSFTELRYWTQYRVIKDAGGDTIIFAGFWLGVTGLVARYLFTQKRLWTVIESNNETIRIILGGSASQFDSLYGEEFAKIVSRMEKEVQYGSK